MGLFDKLESKLEQGVNGAFARAFKAEVQPVEIASGMRRAMDDRASSVKKGQRPVVPNLFTIELSPTDYERLSEWGTELDDELIASAQEHCDEQRYLPGGPLTVVLAEEHDLETGVFRLRPATAKAADALAHSRKYPRPEPQPAAASPAPKTAKPNPANVEEKPARASAQKSASAPHSRKDAVDDGPLSARIKSYLMGESSSSAPQNTASEDIHQRPRFTNDEPSYASEFDPQDGSHADSHPLQSEDAHEAEGSGYDDYAGTSAAQARPQRPEKQTHHGERGDKVQMPARKPRPAPVEPETAHQTVRPVPAPVPARVEHTPTKPSPVENDSSDSTARFTPPPAAPVQRSRTVSPRQRPWLKIDGQRYPLLGAITTLGRDDDADIVIDDPGVSRRHSEVRITHDGPHIVMSIRDLGSTNGTFVNGDRIESEHLRDGDRLTIGRTHMTIHHGDRA